MLLKAPEGATSASHDGDTFDVVDGQITVPQHVGQALLGHGYVEINQAGGVSADDAAAQIKLAADKAAKKAAAKKAPTVVDANAAPAADGAGSDQAPQ